MRTRPLARPQLETVSLRPVWVLATGADSVDARSVCGSRRKQIDFLG